VRPTKLITEDKKEIIYRKIGGELLRKYHTCQFFPVMKATGKSVSNNDNVEDTTNGPTVS